MSRSVNIRARLKTDGGSINRTMSIAGITNSEAIDTIQSIFSKIKVTSVHKATEKLKATYVECAEVVNGAAVESKNITLYGVSPEYVIKTIKSKLK